MFRRKVRRVLQLDMALLCRRSETPDTTMCSRFRVIYRTKSFFIVFNSIQYWKSLWKKKGRPLCYLQFV